MIAILICAERIRRIKMLITFDGPNGAGKTTLIEKIAQELTTKYSIHITREPTTDDFGKYVKKNEGDLHGLSYLFLITANRSEHINKDISLHLNDIILCDRYIGSSLALQNSEGVPLEIIWDVNKYFPKPEISFFISAPHEELEQRINARSHKTHFEQYLSREEEIFLYKNAYNFMKKQNCNVYWINNSKDNYGFNTSLICELIIQKIKEDNTNE